MTTSTTGGGARGRRLAGWWLWLLALVLLLAACDLVPGRFGAPGAEDADFVPVAVLPVSGTYLDGQLEVRDLSWQAGLRRADADATGGDVAGARDGDGSAAVVTGRLLDAEGGVLVEAHSSAEPSAEGGARGDIAEPGSFGLHLSVVDPSTVATLQVDVGEERYEQQVVGTVRVELDELPATLREPLDVGLTTGGEPTQVRVEVQDAATPRRELVVEGDRVHLEPTRYGRGVIHLTALATDGLAADLDSATVEIDVDFEEHLEIHLDIEDGPVRVPAGERYLAVPVTVLHVTAPGEARTLHPPTSTVTFTSDVDGSLDDVNLSDGYGELYADVSGLTPGTHTVTVSVSSDGLTTERRVDVHLER